MTTPGPVLGIGLPINRPWLKDKKPPKPPEPPDSFQEAIDFLEWLRPGGKWQLLSGVPNVRLLEGRMFDDLESSRPFLDQYNGKRNLYYSLNPTNKDLHKKASKEDIGPAEFVHADLDPKGDEEPEVAKKHFRETLEAFRPTPSAVIDSGNGIHVLWRLEVPSDDHAKVEAINKAVTASLGGDGGTWNIDRILRLPGNVQRAG